MEKLKKCPFCGGEAKVFETDLNTFRVICAECSCSVGRYWYYKKEEAITAWNTRKPMERIVERLDSECKKHCDATKKHLGSDKNDLGLRHLGKANAFSKAIEFVKDELSKTDI